MTPPPIDPLWIATAAEVVVHAGAMQRARFGTDVAVDKKGEIDLVTQVDVDIERWFRALIAERFPSHRILAEELGSEADALPVAGRTDCCWVFDPIDGTINYTHGLPIFCASLALEIDGVPSVAAIYDPMREELFTAELGGGARLNGEPLRVSETDTLVDAMLCTGFPYDVHETVQDVVALFGAFVAESRAVRRLGSAAIDLCYVACGRFDGFWEERLHPWDIAAGALIITEAGGMVTGLGGEPFVSRHGSIVASNGRIHDAMLETIRQRVLQRTS